MSEARQKAEEILEDVFEFSDCNDRRTFQKGSFTHTRLIDIIASLLEEQEVLEQEREKARAVIEDLTAHWTGKVRDLTERYAITQDSSLNIAAACYTTAIRELRIAAQRWLEEFEGGTTK